MGLDALSGQRALCSRLICCCGPQRVAPSLRILAEPAVGGATNA